MIRTVLCLSLTLSASPAMAEKPSEFTIFYGNGSGYTESTQMPKAACDLAVQAFYFGYLVFGHTSSVWQVWCVHEDKSETPKPDDEWIPRGSECDGIEASIEAAKNTEKWYPYCSPSKEGATRVQKEMWDWLGKYNEMVEAAVKDCVSSNGRTEADCRTEVDTYDFCEGGACGEWPQ